MIFDHVTSRKEWSGVQYIHTVAFTVNTAVSSVVADSVSIPLGVYTPGFDGAGDQLFNQFMGTKDNFNIESIGLFLPYQFGLVDGADVFVFWKDAITPDFGNVFNTSGFFHVPGPNSMFGCDVNLPFPPILDPFRGILVADAKNIKVSMLNVPASLNGVDMAARLVLGVRHNLNFELTL